MELYIIRHGQSTNNALGEDITNRVMDAPLTDLGHQQAQLVAQHLAGADYAETAFSHYPQQGHREDYGITRMYCSAMHRALQTAQPIARALNLKPEVWVDIHEHGGIYMEETEGRYKGYPGLTRAEVTDQFADYVLPDDLTPQGWWNKDIESLHDLHERAHRVAVKLRQWSKDPVMTQERVALVTHGMFIDCLIKALLDQLPGKQFYYHHYNTAITRIDLQMSGHIDVRFINRSSHLSADMISA
jgi:2,3-bisphosphoglycerate-dependent phosphoglycerate mutase